MRARRLSEYSNAAVQSADSILPRAMEMHQGWQERMKAKALKVAQATERMVQARRTYDGAVREDKSRAMSELSCAFDEYKRACAIEVYV